MAQRIKGQEIEVRLIVDGVLQSTLTDIRSFEVTPKLEKLEEQYLGETTMRYDEIFNGLVVHDATNAVTKRVESRACNGL